MSRTIAKIILAIFCIAVTILVGISVFHRISQRRFERRYLEEGQAVVEAALPEMTRQFYDNEAVFSAIVEAMEQHGVRSISGNYAYWYQVRDVQESGTVSLVNDQIAGKWPELWDALKTLIEREIPTGYIERTDGPAYIFPVFTDGAASIHYIFCRDPEAPLFGQGGDFREMSENWYIRWTVELGV